MIILKTGKVYKTIYVVNYGPTSRVWTKYSIWHRISGPAYSDDIRSHHYLDDCLYFKKEWQEAVKKFSKKK